MISTYRIKETLYIETLNNSVFPLIPVGRRVPINWEQIFTTYFEGQRSFDLHLLRGISSNAPENTTLGKWRIAGIPPAPKGKHQVRVKIRIGVDGSVVLSATLMNKPLPVTFLTEASPKMPLTYRVPTIPLENLIQQPCPACKSAIVMRTENWKNQPFALCLDCGVEFEMPESPAASDTAPWKDLPPELIKTLGIEPPHSPGGLTEEELQELQDKGFDMAISKMKELTPEEILNLAGDPLPENERRNCPKCDAVISRDSTRCEWCGLSL
jgi:molecular chaperone DnaK (HSP70)